MFKPTFLYIKQHSITGLLYFGKTTSSNPEKYTGSGKYWKSHLRKYGKQHVVTLWFCLYTDEEEMKKFAIMFSEQQNIVRSKAWANMITENGLDGGPPGLKHSDEAKRNMSKSKLGKKMTEEHKINSARAKSKPCTIDGVTIYPSVVSLIAANGQGKSGLRHPNFRYVEG